MLKKAIDIIFNRRKNKPKAVQCLWNSDWEYLGISIDLVFKNENGYTKKKVIELEYGDFKTQDALVKEATRIGKKYAEQYGVELYFPSPDEWSRDCPNWWEVTNFPKCKDCNTPIEIPDSKYLSKEVCYPCQLKREKNEKIRNQVPCDDGVNMFLSKKDDTIKLGYCSEFEMFPIAQFIEYKVNIESMEKGINVITVEESEVEKLITDLEKELNIQFSNYEMPKIEKRIEKFIKTKTVEYQGKKYQLIERVNSHHQKIKRLLGSLDTAKKALSEKYKYKIYFRKGITYRDDSILRFINYPQKGKTTVNELEQNYKGVLSVKEIEKSLDKLQELNCISVKKNQIEITDIATKIL